MKVAACNPAMPYCAVMPASTATKAPVGPEICTLEPPNNEVATPATMAVYRPCAGVAPEAMAKAMAKGMATMPTTSPAMVLGSQCSRRSNPARCASSSAITA
jgi:hypothetical protein